jgi:hypothetical protein
MAEPFRIQLRNEQDAVALTRALSATFHPSISRVGTRWQVEVPGGNDRLSDLFVVLRDWVLSDGGVDPDGRMH